MAIKLTIRGRDGEVSVTLKRDVEKVVTKLKRAIEGATADAADEIKERGDRDISHAGNFGTRWTEGFNVVAHQDGLKSKITVAHDIPYASVFQTGKVITGDLWIPLSGTDAVGLRARDYPGGLFRVTRRSDGLELLGSRATGEMKYFHKDKVTIPKKFHLVEICAEVAGKLGAFITRRLRG